MTHKRCLYCKYWGGEGICLYGGINYDSPYEDHCPFHDDVIEEEEEDRIDELMELVRKGEIDFNDLSEEDQLELEHRWTEEYYFLSELEDYPGKIKDPKNTLLWKVIKAFLSYGYRSITEIGNIKILLKIRELTEKLRGDL